MHVTFEIISKALWMLDSRWAGHVEKLCIEPSSRHTSGLWESRPTQVFANRVRYGGVQPQGLHSVPVLLWAQSQHLGLIVRFEQVQPKKWLNAMKHKESSILPASKCPPPGRSCPAEALWQSEDKNSHCTIHSWKGFILYNLTSGLPAKVSALLSCGGGNFTETIPVKTKGFLKVNHVKFIWAPTWGILTCGGVSLLCWLYGDSNSYMKRNQRMNIISQNTCRSNVLLCTCRHADEQQMPHRAKERRHKASVGSLIQIYLSVSLQVLALNNNSNCPASVWTAGGTAALWIQEMFEEIFRLASFVFVFF